MKCQGVSLSKLAQKAESLRLMLVQPFQTLGHSFQIFPHTALYHSDSWRLRTDKTVLIRDCDNFFLQCPARAPCHHTLRHPLPKEIGTAPVNGPCSGRLRADTSERNQGGDICIVQSPARVSCYHTFRDSGCLRKDVTVHVLPRP